MGTRILLLAAVLIGLAAGSEVVDSVSWPEFECSDIVIPAEEFSLDRVRSIATRAMEQKRHLRALRLQVFTDTRDARLSVFGKGVDAGFGRWFAGFQGALTTMRPSAELLMINGSAVLRYRSGEDLRREVIGSTDPLTLQTSQGPAEIITFSCPRRTKAPPNQPGLYAFAVSRAAMSERFGQEVLAVLNQKWVGLHISVSVRNDPWFIDEERFPIFYRYQSALNAPTRDEYRASKTVTCWNSPEPKCLTLIRWRM